MGCSNVFALMCAFVLITLATAKNMPCSHFTRCSDVEDVTWASDGNTCRVFRNPCQLGIENCDRRNRSEAELRVVSKEKCQALCPTMCTMIFMPVCGSYNGVQRTFSNECVMNAHICQSGETYSLFAASPCAGDEAAE